MGLSYAFETVRSNILSMEPLPTVNRAFHMVVQIEKQKEITTNVGQSHDALAVNRARNYSAQGKNGRNHYGNSGTGNGANQNSYNYDNRNDNSGSGKRNRYDKFDRKCTLCQETGHLRENCFKIVGYPEWWKGPKVQGNNKMMANVQDMGGEFNTPFDDEGSTEGNQGNQPDKALINVVVHEVMRAIKGKAPMDEGTSNNQVNSISFAGNLSSKVDVFSGFASNSTWIVDSGATDHVASDKSLFTELRFLNKPIRIGLLDGSTQMVEQHGEVKLSSRLTLHNVLFLASFKHNLISVSQLVIDDDCVFAFGAWDCILQVLSTKEIIARGKKIGGLYKIYVGREDMQLKKVIDSTNFDQGNVINSSKSLNSVCNKSNLELLHARLGHVSLSKLKHVPNITCTQFFRY